MVAAIILITAIVAFNLVFPRTATNPIRPPHLWSVEDEPQPVEFARMPHKLGAASGINATKPAHSSGRLVPLL